MWLDVFIVGFSASYQCNVMYTVFPQSWSYLWYNKTYFNSSTYSCLDAQFYDDETVTVVLKDTVGREGRDRLLVQLPLSGVYNSEDSAEYQFTGTYSTR